MVVVEETAELQITVPNVVRLEERRAQRDLDAVTMRDPAPRHVAPPTGSDPSGRCAAGSHDLLQALNTGHAGTLCTIHASSAVQRSRG